MELLAVGGVAFAVGLSGALSPGPLTVLTIREAARRGWWAGPLATAGHAVVELTLVIVLALGLSRAVEEGAWTAVISLAGGAILVWMGWGLLRTPAERLQAELAAAEEGGVRSRRPGLRALWAVAPAGALVSVANPYWVLWWASVGAKLTADSLDAGVAGPGVFFVGHILSDLAWLTLIAFAVGSGRRRMDVRAYRWVLRVCALFLAGLGVLFLGGGAAELL